MIRLTMAEVIEAVDGPIALTSCVHSDATGVDHANCDYKASCVMPPHWTAINFAVKGALAGVTLASVTPNKQPEAG